MDMYIPNYIVYILLILLMSFKTSSTKRNSLYSVKSLLLF